MSAGEIHAGWHSAESALKSHPEHVLKIWLQQDRDDQRSQSLKKMAHEWGVAIEVVGKAALDKQTSQHQGVIVWTKKHELPSDDQLYRHLETLTESPFVLVLDGIQDPHNFGACLRSAEAAGVNAVIIPRHHAVGITSTVIKVACGAVETLPIFQVTNLVRVIEHLKSQGIWITGLALSEDAQSIFDLDWQGSVAIVMGAEEQGIRPITLKACDRLAIIPMMGQVQSLNVSVATGVVLFTALQQRLKLS